MKNLKKISIVSVLLWTLLLANQSFATVVMVGTRIIFASNNRMQQLQLQNIANAPVVLQAWCDIDNPESTPKTADGPFMIMPSIMRIESNSGQSLRLILTENQTLPQNRESLFYLNLLELPALSVNTQQDNKLVLMVRHRIKIFYRPVSLGLSSKATLQNLRITRIGSNTLHLVNPTGYYITFREVIAQSNGQSTSLGEKAMIQPFEEQNWQLPAKLAAGQLKLIVTIVNDYGGNEQRVFAL